MNGKHHAGEKYQKLTELSMERNPKSLQLTEEQKVNISERTAKIAEQLHAILQLEKTTQMLHNEIVNNMSRLYQRINLAHDAKLKNLHWLAREIASHNNIVNMRMDDFTKTYSQLFADKDAVNDDDVDYYSVLHDCVTLSMGCNLDGTPLNSDYGLYVVRTSYANTVMAADPTAKNNIIVPYDRAVMDREIYQKK